MKVAIIVFAAVMLLCQQSVHSSPTGTDKTVQYHDVAPGDIAPSSRQTRQAGGCSCLARVYDHINYGGRELVISQQNADFRWDFFNNRVESIRLEGNCRWLFYKHLFEGSTHLLNVGYYSSALTWGGSANQISSARALPPSGTTAIVLFGQPSFQGRMVVLYDSDPDLNFLGFNDEILSIIVTGGSWTLFEHGYSNGRSTTRTTGDYPDIHNLNVGGISSVRRN